MYFFTPSHAAGSPESFVAGNLILAPLMLACSLDGLCLGLAADSTRISLDTILFAGCFLGHLTIVPLMLCKSGNFHFLTAQFCTALFAVNNFIVRTSFFAGSFLLVFLFRCAFYVSYRKIFTISLRYFSADLASNLVFNPAGFFFAVADIFVNFYRFTFFMTSGFMGLTVCP